MKAIQGDLTKTMRALGTLAHNRAFSPAELRAVSRGRGFMAVSVRTLLSMGLIERADRGRYWPSMDGWARIQRDAEEAL